MENGSLESVLKKVRRKQIPIWWTTTAKLKVLLGVATAMRILREHWILHRDLKPANILLDRNFEPKLSDFGESKCAPDWTELTNTFGKGTPGYSSPEAIRGETYSFETDVYSFGLLLYAVWTGNDAVSGEDLGRILRDPQSRQPLVFPLETPAVIKALAEQCCDPSRQARPTFEEIVQTLQNQDFLALSGPSPSAYVEYAQRMAIQPKFESGETQLVPETVESDPPDTVTEELSSTHIGIPDLQNQLADGIAKFEELQGAMRSPTAELASMASKCPDLEPQLADPTTECEQLGAENREFRATLSQATQRAGDLSHESESSRCSPVNGDTQIDDSPTSEAVPVAPPANKQGFLSFSWCKAVFVLILSILLALYAWIDVA
jgi:serine/threonine protein kinase